MRSTKKICQKRLFSWSLLLSLVQIGRVKGEASFQEWNALQRRNYIWRVQFIPGMPPSHACSVSYLYSYNDNARSAGKFFNETWFFLTLYFFCLKSGNVAWNFLYQSIHVHQDLYMSSATFFIGQTFFWIDNKHGRSILVTILASLSLKKKFDDIIVLGEYTHILVAVSINRNILFTAMPKKIATVSLRCLYLTGSDIWIFTYSWDNIFLRFLVSLFPLYPTHWARFLKISK